MVDEIVSKIIEIKDVEDWYCYRNELIITFEEELYLYELIVINERLLSVIGSFSDKLFVPVADSNMRKIVLQL